MEGSTSAAEIAAGSASRFAASALTAALTVREDTLPLKVWKRLSPRRWQGRRLSHRSAKSGVAKVRKRTKIEVAAARMIRVLSNIPLIDATTVEAAASGVSPSTPMEVLQAKNARLNGEVSGSWDQNHRLGMELTTMRRDNHKLAKDMTDLRTQVAPLPTADSGTIITAPACAA